MESTNYIDGTTFYLFNILNQTFYDFRIYCINHNKNRPTKYLYIIIVKLVIYHHHLLLQILMLTIILIILYHHLFILVKPTFANILHFQTTNFINTIENNLKIEQYNINIVPLKQKNIILH